MRLWSGKTPIQTICAYNQQINPDLIDVPPPFFSSKPQTQLKNGLLVEIEGRLYLAASYYMRTPHAAMFTALARHLSRESDPSMLPTLETQRRIQPIWAGEMRLAIGAHEFSVEAANETSSFWRDTYPDIPAGVPIRNLARVLNSANLAPWFKFDQPELHAFDPNNQKLSTRLEDFRKKHDEGSHGIRHTILNQSRIVISLLETEYDQARLIESIQRTIANIDHLTTLINLWVDDGLISVGDYSKFESILIQYVFGHELDPTEFLFFTEFIDRISNMIDSHLTPHLVDVFAIET